MWIRTDRRLISQASWLITAIVAMCTAGAAQITATRPPNPKITAPVPQRQGPPSQQQAQSPAGTITGYVYWQMNVFQPQSTCQGLTVKAITVTKQGMPMQLLSSSSNFTAAGPLTDYSSQGTPKYMLCSYSFQNMPENVNLRVLLYGQPTTSSVSMPPTFQIQGGSCGSVPRATLSFILTSGEMLCGDQAFNINFKLNSTAGRVQQAPATATLLQSKPTGSGGQSGMLSPGNTQSAPANSGTVLGNSQSTLGQGGGKQKLAVESTAGASGATQSTTGGATLMQVNPGAGTRPGSPSNRQGLSNADVISLMKAGLPETAIVSKIKSAPGSFDLSPAGCSQLQQAHASANVLNAMAEGSVRPCAGSGQQVKALAGAMKLNPGPVLHLSTPGYQGSNTVLQSLQAQSIATHNERTAFASGSQLTSNGNNRIAATNARTNLVNTVGANQLGPGHTLDATTDPATGGSTPPGSVPPGGTNPNGSNGSGNPPLQTTGGSPVRVGTVGGSSGQGSIMQKAIKANQPISMCRFTTEPVIEAISGKLHNIVLTPDPGTGQYPNNQYTIRGCNFGQMQGHVHIYGAFINNQSPVNLGIDTWSDNLILVTFSPTFQNEYDLSNITLDVVRTDGHTTQLQGLSFYATRVSRPLARIPQSITRLPTTYLQTNDFFSPVTSGSLQSAGLTPITQPTSAAFFLFTPIWTSNATSDGYPPSRLYFGDLIDFSKLRAGFVLDPDMQTLLGKYYADSDCKYYDVVVSANMQGNTLAVGAQPAECDNYGKFVYAYYALELSVTGPKGPLLDPWPTGLQ